MDETKLEDALKLVFEWNREKDKTCNVCHSPRGMGIIDACMSLFPPNCLRAEGGLKGVKAACCGHGDEDPYVLTITGRSFEGIGAFRQHQKWLATSDAQMAMLCDPVLMGWTQSGSMRTYCEYCTMQYSECTCWIWTLSEEGVANAQRRN